MEIEDLLPGLIVEVVSNCFNMQKNAFTWNYNCFEGSNCYALGRVLKRVVGFGYNKHICRTEGPLQTKQAGHIENGTPISPWCNQYH